MLANKPVIYLAGPYTNDAPAAADRRSLPEKRLARFNAVTEVARILIEKKEIVFSPLTMTHPIDVRMSHDPGSEFWVDFDEAFMTHCSAIAVLKLPGWDQSSGVKRELAHFAAKGIEPIWLEPAEFGIVPINPEFAAAFS
jgi:hypothetical protein